MLLPTSVLGWIGLSTAVTVPVVAVGTVTHRATNRGYDALSNVAKHIMENDSEKNLRLTLEKKKLDEDYIRAYGYVPGQPVIPPAPATTTPQPDIVQILKAQEERFMQFMTQNTRMNAENNKALIETILAAKAA